MRRLMLGVAILLLIGCSSGGASPSDEEAGHRGGRPRPVSAGEAPHREPGVRESTTPLSPDFDRLTANAVLPALEKKLWAARSVKVNFFETHMMLSTGSSQRSPAGESKGSLTVTKGGGFSYAEKVRIFGTAYELNASSDGRMMKLSGTTSHHDAWDGALVVDVPEGTNEALLSSFVRNGSDLEHVLGPISEQGRTANIVGHFQVSKLRLGGTETRQGRKARALEYTLQERGTGYAYKMTLWFDVEAGLPVGRDVVAEGGANGHMESSAAYDVQLDGDAPQAVPDLNKAESLFTEMERKLLEAQSLVVEITFNGEDIKLAVEGGGRVLIRTPHERIKNDGRDILTQALSSMVIQTAAGPPDFSHEVCRAFARGGYWRLHDVVRVGTAEGNRWDDTILSQFTWLRRETVLGRETDVIQYRYRGQYSNETLSTLWIDAESRLPVKRTSDLQSFGAAPVTEIYRKIRVNELIEAPLWSL